MTEDMVPEVRSFDSKRRFGAEFEVSPTVSKDNLGAWVTSYEKETGNGRNVHVEGGPKGWAESHGNNFWHVKYDSTCGPPQLGKKKTSGWEIASYIAQGDKDIRNIAGCAQYLADHGVVTNQNCGFHVHAEVSKFTPAMMGALHSVWIAIEPFLIESCPTYRKFNKYCKPLYKKFKAKINASKSAENLWAALRPTNYNSHENLQKKLTLNSVGYAAAEASYNMNRKTVELRLPECLLERVYVENWIRLYLHIVDTVEANPTMEVVPSTESLSDALYYMGLEGRDDRFVILSPSLYEAKVWFLQRMIRNSSDSNFAEQAKKKLDYITHV